MKIKLINDKHIVKKIRQQIKENEGYCPCQIKRTEDTKCICKSFREQEGEGFCHCGLYLKQRNDKEHHE